MASLTINGKTFNVDVEPDTPLLWVIRENVGLTGTKYGCGIAQCGACTVHVDGVAMRSCSMAVSDASGKQITTIEGLANDGTLNKVQQAWIDNDVPQCGYCQSGMIMAVAALLKDNPKPTDPTTDGELAVIWETGKIAVLQDRLASGTGWVVQGANAINDAGQIAAYGFNAQSGYAGFVLTPSGA